MKRLATILALLVPLYVFAQRNKYAEDPRLSSLANKALVVNVVDSLSQEPLEGAHVRVISGKDALVQATNNTGFAVFSGYNVKDSTEIGVSFLGYLPQKQTVTKKRPVFFSLLQDPAELPEVYVTADKVAIVVRGDTTIYNASAFKVMKGGKLRSLLEVIPGMEVKENAVSVGGVPVSKIHLNGHLFFGSNIGAALDMLRYDEVKNVRMYDEYDRERLVEADTLFSPKQRVLDITTNRPIRMIQELFYAISAGVFPTGGEDGPDWAAGASGSFRSFSRNGPGQDLRAGASRNMTEPGKPSDGQGASAYVSYSGSASSRFKNTFNLRYGRQDTPSWEDRIYTDGSSRESSARNDREDNTLNVNYGNSLGIKAGERDALTMSVSGNFNMKKSYSRNSNTVIAPSGNMLSDIMSENRSLGGGAEVTASYRHYFRDNDKRMSLRVSDRFDASGGNGFDVDTTGTASFRQWRTLNSKSILNYASAELSYDQRLSEKIDFDVSASGSAQYLGVHDEYYDKIIEAEDLINSLYRNDEVYRMSAKAGFHFKINPRFSIFANAIGEYGIYLRRNRLYGNNDIRYRLPELSPNLTISYKVPVFSFRVSVKDERTVPELSRLDGRIVTLTPLYLSAGNPNLKAPGQSTVDLETTYLARKANTALKFRSSGSMSRHPVIQAVEYFETDTYLPEHGFTAAAGSELSRPENSDIPSWNTRAEFSADIGFPRAGIKLKPAVQANNAWATSFVNGKEMPIRSSSYGGTLDFLVNFSTWSSLSLGGNASLFSSYREGGLMNSRLIYGYYAKASTILLKRLTLQASYNQRNNLSVGGPLKTPSVGVHLLGAQVSVRLGKKLGSELSLSGHDLLNTSKSLRNQVTDHYVATMFSPVLGRALIVTFRHSFRPAPKAGLSRKGGDK